MQQGYKMLFRMNERKEIWHPFLIKIVALCVSYESVLQLLLLLYIEHRGLNKVFAILQKHFQMTFSY